MIPYGGTIVRPGVIAWDGMLSSGMAPDSYSCEAVEQAIMAAMGEAASDETARLDDLLAELARARVWLPLPDGRKPVKDGSALVLPLITVEGDGFVPAFTSVQRLAAWCDPRTRRSNPASMSGPVRSGDPAVAQDIASGTGPAGPGGRHAPPPALLARGDDPPNPPRGPRMFRHVVVPFHGLASLLPTGLGIAINPGTGVSLQVFPDAVTALPGG